MLKGDTQQRVPRGKAGAWDFCPPCLGCGQKALGVATLHNPSQWQLHDLQANLVLLHFTLLRFTMLRFSQIEGETLHQQKEYNSLPLLGPLLHCGALDLNLQYLRGLPV